MHEGNDDTVSPVNMPVGAPRALVRAVTLTLWGLWAERLARAFWPLWTAALICISAMMLGLVEMVPVHSLKLVLALVALIFAACLIYALRRFRRPKPQDALSRLDASLPGRPLQAMRDQQATGASDQGSAALWAAHQAQMAQRAAQARRVAPDLRLASRDPYALRYIGALAFGVAALFGSFGAISVPSGLTGKAQAASAAQGPVWEGWAEPPAYTGLPTLYLADQETGFAVPAGSRILLRFYGAANAFELSQTISQGPEQTQETSAAEVAIIARNSGFVGIDGPGGRSWDIDVRPDAAPQAEFIGPAERTAEGHMQLPFHAADDYGIVRGQARIALDLTSVVRRYGLRRDPEHREDIIVEVPLPFRARKAAFDETLLGDFSKHGFANLPVSISLQVEDAAEQSSETVEMQTILPGRRFFDPLAQALIEQRQALIWSKENAADVALLLRALSHQPDEVFRSNSVYLQLRAVLRRIEQASAEARFDDALRDEVTEALWDMAVGIEEADLDTALERMRRAQERLSEAMKNGASRDEIAQLMDELRRANEDYINQLQREAARDRETGNSERDEVQQDAPSMTMTQDDLAQMMDQIQQLMEQGRMAEAEQALNELQQMMENMQVAEGEGQPSEGEQAMEELSESLRQQQGLSDQAFRDLQEQMNPGARAGQSQGNEGRSGGEGRGQSDEGGQGSGQSQPGGTAQGQQEGSEGSAGELPGQSGREGLAQRQNTLRLEVERQRGALPGAGSEAGDAARDALRRAEDAMRGAGDAIEQGDLPGAMEHQSDAMDALRDGLKNLGEAVAQEQGRGGQQNQQGARGNSQSLDPLGRNAGASGQAGGDEGVLQGEDVYRRARELLDEIRKKSGESGRSDTEIDYLRRLLDRF